MKFVCPRTDLLSALQVCLRAAGARVGVPALSGVLFELSDDGLLLTTTDLELTIRVRMDVRGQVGRVLLPVRLLADLTRLMSAGEVELVDEGAVVRFGGGTAQFALRSLPADDLPLTRAAPRDGFELDGESLRRAVERVAGVAARDELRPVLSAVLLEHDGVDLSVVATDDYRLAWQRLPAPSVPPFALLVPARAVAELSRLVSGVVRVSVDAGWVRFETGDVELTARLIDSQYPPFRRLLSGERPYALRADRASVLQAVQLVAALSRDEPVTLELGQEFAIVAQSPAVGEGREQFAGAYDGPEMRVLLNPAYLTAGVAAVEGDQIVVELSSPTERMVVRGADEAFTYVLNPIRRR